MTCSMDTIDKLERFFITESIEEVLKYLKIHNYIQAEHICEYCGKFCDWVAFSRETDKYAWKCCNSDCINYFVYVSVRTNSFFDSFSTSFEYLFKVILKYSARMPQHSIVASLDISKPTIIKIIKKLISRIPDASFGEDKLGKGGRIVQVDETMLNYKCKSHRGRSSTNRTDSISIIEIDNGITRCFAKTIPDKTSATLVPIICQDVCHGATIHTDEHRSYQMLPRFGFVHGTVCHKYEFIIRIDDVNTQAVESFHSVMKYWIKARKGILTNQRDVFLKEFTFYFNNKENYMEAIVNLIKR